MFATYTHNHFVVITEVNLCTPAQPVMYWRILLKQILLRYAQYAIADGN